MAIPRGLSKEKNIFKSNVIISLLNLTIKKKNMQKLKGWDFIFVRIEVFLIVLFGVIGRGEKNFFFFTRLCDSQDNHF